MRKKRRDKKEEPFPAEPPRTSYLDAAANTQPKLFIDMAPQSSSHNDSALATALSPHGSVANSPSIAKPTVSLWQPYYSQYDRDYFVDLQGSDDEDVEDDDYDQDYLDAEDIRDDDYLEQRRTRLARQSRGHLDVQFCRGRGCPPGPRRAYSNMARTMSTRSRTID